MERFKTENMAAEKPKSREQLDRELLLRLKKVFDRNGVSSKKLLSGNLNLSPEEIDNLMAEVGTLNDVSQETLKDIREDYPEFRS
jgi:hypothetical protein